jgi:sigma-B regulation protein RsbU (phosphoserine phosphatase)
MRSKPYKPLITWVLLLILGVLISARSAYAAWAILRRGNDLKYAHERLAWQHQEMSDSIHSAKYLQKSVLLTQDDVKQWFEDSFVLFKPKDAVSGDFLWVHGSDEFRLLAVVDCTGHGVSAALLSMIAGQLLHQIVVLKNITTPADILRELDAAVTSILQSKNRETSMDGMDIILCRFDVGSSVGLFAGANRPLYAQTEEGLLEMQTTRKPIGGYRDSEEKHFKNQLLDLTKVQQLFIATDGYHSQFGGNGNKKLGRKRLREILKGLTGKPSDTQMEELRQEFRSWKGKLDQVDDVLIVGIKV